MFSIFRCLATRCSSRAEVDKLFTRRARFGKTVEAVGRALIGKQDEDLFSLLWRSHSSYECNLQNKKFSPHFSFQFCTVEAYLFENHCHPWSLKEKKVFRSIYGGNLSLCKCRRARIKEPAGRIWPAGRSLPMSALKEQWSNMESELPMLVYWSKKLLRPSFVARVYYWANIHTCRKNCFKIVFEDNIIANYSRSIEYLQRFAQLLP